MTSSWFFLSTFKLIIFLHLFLRWNEANWNKSQHIRISHQYMKQNNVSGTLSRIRAGWQMNSPSVVRGGRKFSCNLNRTYRVWDPLFHEYRRQSALLRAQYLAPLSDEINKILNTYTHSCVPTRCAQGNLTLNLSYYEKLADASTMTLHFPLLYLLFFNFKICFVPKETRLLRRRKLD